MKYTFTSYILILVCACLLPSCKDNWAGDAINTYLNKISADINGSNYNSTNTDLQTSTASGKRQVTITGNAGKQKLTIIFKNYTATTGTFNIDNSATGSATAVYNDGVSMDKIALSGQLVITDVDNSRFGNGPVITGTFNFTAQNNITVTNGTFSGWVRD